jgi:hypothetical protein
MTTRVERVVALSKWTLQQITGEIRDLDQPIASHDDYILRSGIFKNNRGEQLMFAFKDPGGGPGLCHCRRCRLVRGSDRPADLRIRIRRFPSAIWLLLSRQTCGLDVSRALPFVTFSALGI